MIIAAQREDGKWIYSCSECSWRIGLREHKPVGHTCGGNLVGYKPERFNAKAYTERAKAQRAISKAPGLLQRGVNFAFAATEHILTGMHKASDEIVAERWAVCHSNKCGLFKEVGDGKGMCQHSTCGCGVQEVESERWNSLNKLRWEEQECPVGEWKKIIRLPIVEPPSLS